MAEFTDIPFPVFKPIEEEMANIDQVYDNTSDRRERIYRLLEDNLGELKFSINGDPEKLESQTKFVDMALKALNDMEKSAATRASLKLRVKSQEQSTELSGGITELLKSIDMRNQNGLVGISLTEEDGARLVQNQFQERGCAVIRDEELSPNADEVFCLSAVLQQEEEDARRERDAR